MATKAPHGGADCPPLRKMLGLSRRNQAGRLQDAPGRGLPFEQLGSAMVPQARADSRLKKERPNGMESAETQTVGA